MRNGHIGIALLAAMTVAGCSVPSTAQHAAPSTTPTAAIVQAAPARTAPAASTSPAANASPSASPDMSTTATVDANGNGTAATQPTHVSIIPTITPSAVVIDFLRSVQQALNSPQNVQYLGSNLAQRVQNGQTVGSLLQVGDDPANLYIDYSADILGASGNPVVVATLVYNNGTVQRQFGMVDEGQGWRIDTIEDTTPSQPPVNPSSAPARSSPPTPTALLPAAVQPLDVVNNFMAALIQDPSGESSKQYLAPGTGGLLSAEELFGRRSLAGYQAVPLDDGSGAVSQVSVAVPAAKGDIAHTFHLQRAGQKWLINTIY